MGPSLGSRVFFRKRVIRSVGSFGRVGRWNGSGRHGLPIVGVLLLALFCLAAPAAGQATDEDAPPPSKNGQTEAKLRRFTWSGVFWGDLRTGSREDEDSSEDGFRVARARLTGRGNLSKRVDWNATFELTTHSPRGLYMNVKAHDYLTVQFGQFVPPFSLERAYSTYILEVIGRSNLVLRLGYPENIGVMAFSPRPIKKWVSYGVSVVTGPGINRWDDNEAKDVTARLVLSPPRFPGLALGVSAASGEQPIGTRTRSGVGVQYTRPKFSFGAEHLRESQEGRRDRLRDGFWVLGAYRVRPRTKHRLFHMVELSGRYLSIDLGDRTKELQAGGNYYIRPRVRFMVNGVFPVADHNDVASPTLLVRTQILFQ
jgi:phosphate-selective porin